MTEVPGTDRDQARENVQQETPILPDDIEGADDDPLSTEDPDYSGDEGQTGESVKPTPGSTDLGRD